MKNKKPAVQALNAYASIQKQRGVALVFVLIMMSIAIALGLATSNVTLMGERSARYDRDRQIAFQAAEFALGDAEFDIMDTNSDRGCKFGSASFVPTEGVCLSTADGRGFCGSTPAASGVEPDKMYKTIDWEDTNNTSRSYAHAGEFSGRTLGLQLGNGIGTSRTPSYIIVASQIQTEVFQTTVSSAGTKTTPFTVKNSYRIYALGYGINPQTQVMLETQILKPYLDKDCATGPAL
jgi:type IV pilus assembly protein PilX